jgi:alkylhydroperoxidase family enzyme
MFRDPEQRMDDVVGAPMRVAALEGAEFDQRTLDNIDRLQRLNDLPPQKVVHHFYGAMARSPEIFAAFLDLGTELMGGSAIATRERELAILRVGWLCGGPYVWGEHVISGKRAGLSSEEIERVTEGSGAEGWTARERVVLRAVEELHANAMIADATWSELATHFDDRQLVELPILVGHYHLTIFVQNALRIPLNTHNPGLSLR